MNRYMTQHGGFTLLEVLVTLVVVAIGLLGLAGLQLTALQNNHSAYMRSQATILAGDIIDRVKANSAAVTAGDYNEGTANQDTNCESASAGCSSAAMAGNDLYQWESALASQLPNGKGVVCIDSSPDDGTDETNANNGCNGTGSMYVVKIWWTDDHTTGTMQRFVTTFKP